MLPRWFWARSAWWARCCRYHVLRICVEPLQVQLPEANEHAARDSIMREDIVTG